MFKAPNFTNGIKNITIADDWGYDRKYSITQTEPQAINIKNITYEVSI